MGDYGRRTPSGEGGGARLLFSSRNSSDRHGPLDFGRNDDGVFVGLHGSAVGSCPPGGPNAAFDNPIFVPASDPNQVWDGVTHVVTEYFKIDREEPVRVLNHTPTTGVIETYPKVGATLLEPWDHDSANTYERLESTLQSIRRRAVVQVVPAQGGYWVSVQVFKDLENMNPPENASVGTTTFKSAINTEATLTRVINPAAPPAAIDAGWIPQGRDPVLEQRMLGQLRYVFTPEGSPIPLP